MISLLKKVVRGISLIKFCFIIAVLLGAFIFSYIYRVDISFDMSVRRRNHSHSVSVGDIMQFGSYYGEPIKWKVVGENGNQKLILAEKGIEIKQYHNRLENVTWENSSIRKWLNGEFFETAFGKNENVGILLSAIVNNNNERFGTLGGKNTKDRIFLLSIEEAKKYFSSDKDRVCQPSQHALENVSCYVTWEGAIKYEGTTLEQKYEEMGNTQWFSEVYSKLNEFDNNKDNSWWLLRSPGRDSMSVAVIHSDGSIDYAGGYVTNHDEVVRPAMWVDMDKF